LQYPDNLALAESALAHLALLGIVVCRKTSSYAWSDFTGGLQLSLSFISLPFTVRWKNYSLLWFLYAEQSDGGPRFYKQNPEPLQLAESLRGSNATAPIRSQENASTSPKTGRGNREIRQFKRLASLRR
ncbi:MAG: hypothetical protein AB1722_01650, partial [Pseudomonadota bacterium]